MRADGYANVQEVLNNRKLKSMKVTFAEIRDAVTESDKQRFKLIRIGEDGTAENDVVTKGEVQRTKTNDDEAKEDGNPTKAEGPFFQPVQEQEDDDPINYLIRANQGHSIRTIAATDLLTRILPSDAAESIPNIAVHGTTHSAWPLIVASGGLKPMGRNHVHFASGLPAGFQPQKPSSTTSASGSATTTAEEEGGDKSSTNPNPKAAKATAKGAASEAAPVISGMRNSSTVLIFLDVPRALAAGLELYRSANGVILSPGIVGAKKKKENVSSVAETLVAVAQPGEEDKKTEAKEQSTVIEGLAVSTKLIGDNTTTTGNSGGGSDEEGKGSTEQVGGEDGIVPLELFSRVEDRTGHAENGLLVLDGKILRDAPAWWGVKGDRQQQGRRGGRGGGRSSK
jgi:2'-phosphotransferase